MAFGHRLGDTEVENEGVAVGEKDVLRLDIAVYDAGLVGLGEGIGDLAGVADYFVEWQRPGARETGAEGFAADVRHHIVEQSAVGSRQS